MMRALGYTAEHASQKDLLTKNDENIPVAAEPGKPQSDMNRAMETAQLSKRGRVIIAGAVGHVVQETHPQVVVGAVNLIVDRARSKY
jgi:hypothetical protein